MSESIIVAIITAFGSMLGTSALVNWRLQALEKKVDIHNGYAEKFGDIQTDIALMRQDINHIKDSIK